MRRKGHLVVRLAGLALGGALVVGSLVYLAGMVEANALGQVARAVLADPLGLGIALTAYGSAFALRAWAWRLTFPGIRGAQAWSAMHVALLGNHVLPLRLGEPMRVTSVLRRTALPAGPVTASAVTLRAADVLTVLALAAISAPTVLAEAGLWVLGAVGLVLVVAGSRRRLAASPRAAETAVRLPGGRALAATGGAWVLEAAVVWEIATVSGVPLTAWEAIAVTAATIAAQTIAVTPGGFGSYEAAATAAMVAVGVPAGAAFAGVDHSCREDRLRISRRQPCVDVAGAHLLGPVPAAANPARPTSFPSGRGRRSRRCGDPGAQRGSDGCRRRARTASDRVRPAGDRAGRGRRLKRPLGRMRSRRRRRNRHAA